MKNQEEIKKFGTHIRKLREENNLSQAQLAFMAEISRNTVYRIENGLFCVTIDVIISLAKALEIPYLKVVNYNNESLEESDSKSGR